MPYANKGLYQCLHDRFHPGLVTFIFTLRMILPSWTPFSVLTT